VNGQSVAISNRSVNVHAAELFFEIGLPIMAASDNPFERVPLKKLTGTINVTPEARDAKILSVNLPRRSTSRGRRLRFSSPIGRSAAKRR
jgi:hypothetical protein